MSGPPELTPIATTAVASLFGREAVQGDRDGQLEEELTKAVRRRARLSMGEGDVEY